MPELADADFVIAIEPGLVSEPVLLYMPDEEAWDSDAGDWYAAAEDVLSDWAWASLGARDRPGAPSPRSRAPPQCLA